MTVRQSLSRFPGVFTFVRWAAGDEIGVLLVEELPAVGWVIEVHEAPVLVTAVERTTGDDEWLSTRITCRPYGFDVRVAEQAERLRKHEAKAAVRDHKRLAWLREIKAWTTRNRNFGKP